jgi:hypothetical protein
MRRATLDKFVKAVPLDDFRIEIVTSSGIPGIFDVKPYLGAMHPPPNRKPGERGPTSFP